MLITSGNRHVENETDVNHLYIIPDNQFPDMIMDNLSNFVSLEPAEACTAEVTAKYLLN